mgnify:CR=1 FL=1
MNTQFTIDAKGLTLGRVASKAAAMLMGKNTTTFVKNKVPSVTVTIVNAAKTILPEKKLREVDYARYSGYPGGLRYETLGEVLTKKGHKEVYKVAVYGMLPHNKLRSKMIKNLIVTE